MKENDKPPIEMTWSEWTIVCSVLKNHVPDISIWAFGSRAKWKAKPFSDLDLVLVAEKPIGFKKINALKMAFDESKLPFSVDLLEWVNIPESFKEIIQADHVKLNAKCF